MGAPEEKKYKEVKLPENVEVNWMFEKMLKGFIKQVDKDDILKEVKARRYHIKDSEKKRLAKKEMNKK